MTADQVAAEHEKQIDTDPAEAMPVVREGEAENAGVVNDNQDDRDGAEKVETGLTLAILKARIDCCLTHGFIDARNIADSRSVHTWQETGSDHSPVVSKMSSKPFDRSGQNFRARHDVDLIEAVSVCLAHPSPVASRTCRDGAVVA